MWRDRVQQLKQLQVEIVRLLDYQVEEGLVGEEEDVEEEELDLGLPEHQL